MAQSIEGLTLDFGSGHDLTVCGFEPHLGLHTEVWSLLGILSLSLSLSLCSSPTHMYTCMRSLSK